MSAGVPAAATDAAARVRAGEVSARELTEDVLARIDALDPVVNAVVELRREAALAEADRADAAVARGDAVGPLHGVPITVKEALHVEGMHATWGNPAFAGWVADRDATVVARLRRAGAVVVGTTNVATMLGDFGQTANEVYGRTANPWDPARAAGGSSGGSAAAVASGMSYLDVGSDLTGSVRIPAALCGVYGLRPTAGTVPLTGFAPPGPDETPGEMAHLSTLGPLARTAADLRLALGVAGGPEGPSARAYRWALAPPRRTRLADVRIGVVLDDPACPVSGEVGGPLSDAVDALAAAGATVVEGWPDGVDPVAHAETFAFHVELFFAFADPGAGGQGDDAPTLDRIVAEERRRTQSRAAWERHFADVDVWLCPVTPTAAFPHDDRSFEERTITTPEGERSYFDLAFWSAHAALPGLPAVSAPVGTTPSGLPVGMQVVGPMHADDTAVTVAELAADVIGGYAVPPAVT